MLTAQTPELIDALRQGGLADRTLEGWIDQCRALTMQDPERGVTASARLVEIAQGSASRRLQARAYSAHCHALSYAGKLKQAIGIADRALELAEESGDESALAEACLTAVQSHNLLGLREEALTLASRAGEIFSRTGDGDRAATSTMLAGVVLRMLDRPDEALERFDHARALIGENLSLRAQLASNRAEALLDLGRFADAEASFQAAAEGFHSIGQRFGEAIVEGNLADLASRRGRLREALGLFLSASEKFLSADDEPEAARLEAEAAELFLAIGDHREALTRLPEAIEKLHEAGMQTEHTRALAALGVALGRAGQFEASLASLQEAEEQSEQHNQVQAVARIRMLAGEITLRQGDASRAMALLERALEAEPLAPVRARLLLDLARAQLALGNMQAASDSIEEARSTVNELGLFDLEAEVYAADSARARLAGEHDRAREALEEALTSVESRRRLFSGDRLRSAALGGRAMVFEEGIRLALDRNDAALALRVSETATARSLADRLGAGESLTQSSERDAIEGDIAATLQAIEDARNAGRSETHIAQLRAQLRSSEILSSREEVRDEPRLAASNAGRIDLEMEQLQRTLPDRSAAIVFAFAGDSLAAVTITPAGLTLHRVPLSSDRASQMLSSLLTDIDRALVRLTIGREVSPGLDQRITGALDDLGETLLGHLADTLDTLDRIVLVLPGCLSQLPVAALRVRGRSLVEYCTPVIAPSLAWALASPETDSSGREGLLAVGASDEVAPWIDAEMDAIARARPEACVLQGDKATLDRLRSSCGRASTVHLACHAEYSPIDPMGSRLRLADGWVSGRVISDLDLRGTDVVLGGCETGSTDSSHAGEQFGLIRAALLAGARSVIASRWRLSDVTASTLFSELYSPCACGPIDLQCGLSRLQARAAKNAVHPALWGGLFALGSWT